MIRSQSKNKRQKSKNNKEYIPGSILTEKTTIIYQTESTLLHKLHYHLDNYHSTVSFMLHFFMICYLGDKDS